MAFRVKLTNTETEASIEKEYWPLPKDYDPEVLTSVILSNEKNAKALLGQDWVPEDGEAEISAEVTAGHLAGLKFRLYLGGETSVVYHTRIVK